jgi:dTMP kinase
MSVFIDFEGIDGSGKTTLSNRLAQRLAKMGYRVSHAREGGELQSPLARRIRELTRDAQLLEMCPQAEFFLNLARDAQQLSEVIRPALEQGNVCISDRYVYSQIALAAAGRGLSGDALMSSTQLAAQERWPDLVILVDVDPELARLRKRLGKISRPNVASSDSRKGLAGAGLNVRIRQCFLEMAGREPDRWVVVDNSSRPLWEVEDEIVECVLSRLEKRPPKNRTGRPPRPSPSVTLETIESHFFAALDELEAREPALAAYLLNGVAGQKAHLRRLSMLERFPAIIAKGLNGLHDEESNGLRDILKTLAPAQTAGSLGTDSSDRSMALRAELYGEAPAEVAASLKNNDSERAWALREAAVRDGFLSEVLLGLSGVDSAPAWELRADGLRQGVYAATARSLTGLSSENANEVRRVVFPRDRLAVVKSLTGLDSPFAQQLRIALFDKALKVVLRSLSGVDAPYADDLRERAAGWTKEALDSVDGLDTAAAWNLRARYWKLWPSTAISSLGALAKTPRGCALIQQVLSACPGKLAALRNAYATLCQPKPAIYSPSSSTATLTAVVQG